MSASVFHLDRQRVTIPDPELAALLRELPRQRPTIRMAALMVAQLANAVDAGNGAQPGAVHTVNVNHTVRREVADVLAEGAARAAGAGHPAAARLAEVAAQWETFTTRHAPAGVG